MEGVLLRTEGTYSGGTKKIVYIYKILKFMNPRISEFFWIKINMYFWDHNPPHFHVKYNEYECFMSIKDTNIIEWALPPKVAKLVSAWAEMYQEDLMKNWDLAINEKPLIPILPFIK